MHRHVVVVTYVLDRLIRAQSNCNYNKEVTSPMMMPIIMVMIKMARVMLMMMMMAMAWTTCKLSDVWSSVGQAHKSTVHGIDHL